MTAIGSMRDDLLDARTSVDWAVAQLDILQRRIDGWLQSGPCVAFTKENPQTGQQSLCIDITDPPPDVIFADVGMIIHGCRSSLDILANTLAERNGVTGRNDIYFPVCADITGWTQPKRGGLEKVQWLAATDQAAIEALQPYHGGNNNRLLFALHKLDGIRKHRKLLDFHTSIPGISIMGFKSLRRELADLYRAQTPEKGYIVVPMPGEPDSQMQVRIEITLNEAGFRDVEPAVSTLAKFTGLANSIINLFDA